MLGNVIAYVVAIVIIIWWLVYWPLPSWPGRKSEERR